MTDRSTPRRSLDEIRAELREYQREQRDREIRRGKRRPRTQRETKIWLAGLAERHPKRAESDDEAPDGR